MSGSRQSTVSASLSVAIRFDACRRPNEQRNVLPSATHITLGWGRDYEDVSPIRGIILGGGEHALHVSVNVMRLESGPTA